MWEIDFESIIYVPHQTTRIWKKKNINFYWKNFLRTWHENDSRNCLLDSFAALEMRENNVLVVA
jgi:hypothetical protein